MALRKNAKVELIKSVPLFSHCSKKELEALASQADELSVGSGKEIATQGARGREFIVLVDGTAQVSQDGRNINRLRSGDFLGEIALLTDSPRTATVTTTSDATLLVLTDRAFARIVKEMPSVQGSVMKALAERLHADSV